MESIEEKWKKIQELLKDMDPKEAAEGVSHALFMFALRQMLEAWLDDVIEEDYEKMRERVDIVNKLMFDKDPKNDKKEL